MQRRTFACLCACFITSAHRFEFYYDREFVYQFRPQTPTYAAPMGNSVQSGDHRTEHIHKRLTSLCILEALEMYDQYGRHLPQVKFLPCISERFTLRTMPVRKLGSYRQIWYVQYANFADEIDSDHCSSPVSSSSSMNRSMQLSTVSCWRPGTTG